jgi:hypothetical protein
LFLPEVVIGLLEAVALDAFELILTVLDEDAEVVAACNEDADVVVGYAEEAAATDMLLTSLTVDNVDVLAMVTEEVDVEAWVVYSEVNMILDALESIVKLWGITPAAAKTRRDKTRILRFI